MEGAVMMRCKKRSGCKIVVAVDESEESMYALSWCLSNLFTDDDDDDAAAASAQLVLLYVKPPSSLYSSFDVMTFSNAALDRYGNDLVKSVMTRAEAVCRRYINISVKVERLVGSGDAKDVICGTVDKIKADTLVIGSHGYGFFKRALLGSVSDHCAKHAKCPVVIVKHPHQHKKKKNNL